MEIKESLVFYIDFDSIRSEGNFRKVWAINDFKKLDGDGEMSTRFRLELDCKEEKFRTITISSHSQNMAKGMPLRSVTPEFPKWGDIAPDTPIAATLKLACAS